MKNRKFKKSTYIMVSLSLILFVLGLGMTLVGTAMGGIQKLDGTHVFGRTIRTAPRVWDMTKVDVEPFTNVNVDTTNIPVYFVADENYYVEYPTGVSAEPQVSVTDGTLNVVLASSGDLVIELGVGVPDDIEDVVDLSMGYNDGEEAYYHPCIYIHCPQRVTYGTINIKTAYASVGLDSMHMNKLAINANTSDVDMFDVQAGDMDLTASYGNVYLNRLDVNNLKVNVDRADLDAETLTVRQSATIIGKYCDVELAGYLNGTSAITMDTGDVGLNLADPETAYKLAINATAGTAEVNDGPYRQTVANEGAPNSLTIDSKYGDVDVNFGIPFGYDE